MTHRRWTYAFLTVAAAAMSAVIAFNVIVDPYRIFNVADTGTPQIHNKERIAHSINLRRQQFDTIVIGSSRTQFGIDVESPALRGSNTYNASLIGTNVYEIEKVVGYMLDHQRGLGRVIYGVDFLTFTTRRELNDEFRASLFEPGNSMPMLMLRLACSYDTLTHSIETLKARDPEVFWNQGYRNKEAVKADNRQLFDMALSMNFFVDPETYACFEYGRDRLWMFEDAVKRMAARGVRVHAFIPPLHARQYEAVEALGLTPAYLRWLGDMAVAVHNVELAYPGMAALYDFSGYNEVTTEPIPRDAETRMKHYWESSHYRAGVGEAMLKTMLDGQGRHADFGVRLTPDNVEGVIEKFSAGRQLYASEHPEEVQRVLGILESTRAERLRNCPSATR